MPEFPPLPRLTNSRRFRLGVTSYVVPADLQTNVALAAPVAADIELVLFDTPTASNLPGTAELRRLADLAAVHDLTYTVHFPGDLRLGSPDPGERRAAVAQTLRLIRLTAALPVWGYILHPEGIEPGAGPAEIQAWQHGMAEAVAEVLTSGIAPDRFCLENLRAPYAWCEPLLEQFNLSVCLDAGHLWLGGYPLRPHLDRYLGRTRIIHLHGVAGNTDHISLDKLAPEQLREFLEGIRDYTGVVTLEMFDDADVRSSLERLNAFLTKNVVE